MIQNLDNFKQRAIQAYSNTSFSPEKRGQATIDEFNEKLKNDAEELRTAGAREDIINGYILKFIQFFSSWLASQARMASPMITGPANFPKARMRKYNDWEQRKYETFMYWRERAKKAIKRNAAPEKTFASELERYCSELAGMQKNHELMKEGNKRIKQAHKTGEDLTEYLTVTFGIKPHMIEWTMKFGFGLQNNNANMKRVEERIKILSAKKDRAETTGRQEINFEGGKVVLNYEIDRLQIMHDSKPEQSIINNLKSGGFRWSPSNKCWQRQITREAKYKAELITGVKL